MSGEIKAIYAGTSRRPGALPPRLNFTVSLQPPQETVHILLNGGALVGVETWWSLQQELKGKQQMLDYQRGL